MKLSLNRFLPKSEVVKPPIESFKDSRHDLLEFLLGLCARTSKSKELASLITAFEFPKESTLADLHLVKFYLDLENYLLYIDPAYISTKEKLRNLIKSKFPHHGTSKAFLPLYEHGKNQELVLANHFLTITLQSFTANPLAQNVAIRWLGVIESKTSIKTSPDPVQQIHLSRKLVDKTNLMHQELLNKISQDTINKTFKDHYSQFQFFYKRLKNWRLMENILESSGGSTSIAPSVATSPSKKQPKHKAATPVINNIQRNILEHILDGFILFDHRGSVLEHNQQALDIFGITVNHNSKLNILELLPDDLEQKLKYDLQNNHAMAIKQCVGKRLETTIENHKGKTDHFEITITNNYTEEVDTYSMFLKNITDRMDTLHNIENAKVNAERMAKTKSTFLSNMSHEIRTPLNVILGLSELIKTQPHMEAELLQKNLSGIDFSAKNLLAIVNDILDFSKIEAGKLSIQSLDFNLRKVVTNLTDGFEIKAREKGLQMITQIEPRIPNIVIGDQYRLNQILNNLIGNAIKFTKEGKITITVDLVSEKENEISLKFMVNDSGIGIPKEQLNQIFDSFYQVEDVSNSKVIGTGLGLSITKELIHLLDGKLKASSTPGIGSAFEFVIPFQKSTLTGVDNSITKQLRKDEQLSGLRVLVAEDNQMNQFYIKQLLSNLNVTVDIVENGQEAVSTFKHSNLHYDLIMMDMHMPVMNGIDAIKIIRQSNKNSLKKVPIVACSADVFPEARKEAIKAGIDFYLTKPLSEESIKEVLFWLISDEDALPIVSKEENTSHIVATKTEQQVDINMLMETFDNDVDFIITLLEVFIQSTPEDYKSMRHCMDKEYYPRASSLAHKLKSSFQNLGMTTLGHHLQQIETNTLSAAGLPEAKHHFKAFNKLYPKALREVNIILIELRQK